MTGWSHNAQSAQKQAIGPGLFEDIPKLNRRQSMARVSEDDTTFSIPGLTQMQW